MVPINGSDKWFRFSLPKKQVVGERWNMSRMCVISVTCLIFHSVFAREEYVVKIKMQLPYNRFRVQSGLGHHRLFCGNKKYLPRKNPLGSTQELVVDNPTFMPLIQRHDRLPLCSPFLQLNLCVPAGTKNLVNSFGCTRDSRKKGKVRQRSTVQNVYLLDFPFQSGKKT